MKKIMRILGILLLVVLAGCSAQEITGNVVKQTYGEQSSADSLLFVAKEGDLSAGETKAFKVNDQDAVLVNFNGKYVAYYATCPVHKLAVTGGEGKLVCPHSTYNFDGTAKSGPALANNAVLTTINIIVKEGNIYAG